MGPMLIQTAFQNRHWKRRLSSQGMYPFGGKTIPPQKFLDFERAVTFMGVKGDPANLPPPKEIR